MDTQAINDERLARIEKLKQLKEEGINPYPAESERTHVISEIRENFDQLMSTEAQVTVPGRLRLLRRHGGSSFARIEDESGEIQLFFNKKILGEETYALLKQLDVADFIQISGQVFLTRTEEQTIQVQSLTVLSKALRPLPDKYYGFKDEEQRFRHRYVDLLVNDEVKDTFKTRSRFIQHMRQALVDEGFLEVETPVLEQVPGGADAEPFVTHHNALDIDLYLRISLELHLKRLTVGGFEKVFEIGKVFRNEGVSTQHLQEFSEMEFYWAYADNEKLMEFVQRLYQEIIEKTFGTLSVTSRAETLDFSGDWPRYDYRTLFKKQSGIDLSEAATAYDLRAAINKKGINIKLEENAGYGRIIDQVYKKLVRPTLVQPCFLINHPLAISPLAKKDSDNPRVVQRHQVVMLGSEVGNGFSELNDPIDQRERFEEQMKLREAGDKEAQMIDEDFITALEHGMPPTAGFGVGIDRLFMILTDQPSIRDVVFFPTMRPEQDA